ncbi:nedd8-activating enzyme E1 regulatory subunit-like [Toxorhynchites rutilus septentrionalis]|uniref:nedd8-activating enzyme E1 regulatory subunit-like n=1 Tax=Toxorhynchites rutilus septentrionalis TaxID=329112 RepID=UPI0024790B06|nr:nedd8-activating enzyme E1 regulatory subunit-like [Toxorhynchites rutilus septentrionalis]
MSSLVPQSSGMCDKNQKYDRQIRLWGEHGQTILENSHVCLINATVLGVEILKSIVLPGVGGFTIVDDKLATEEDIGSNFFLDWRSIGQSRAKGCMRLLQELNPDVCGEYVDENINQIIDTQQEFFKKFQVVVATAIDERTIVRLSTLLWEQDIPLIVCRSIGFYGVARVQIKEHCIVESHPDNILFDLRLEKPFEGLKKYMAETGMTSKVPWLVVLYKYLQEWVDGCGRRYPILPNEKTEFREFIRLKMVNGENFEEAIRAVNSSFGGGKPNSLIEEILADNCCVSVNNESKPFWVLVRALRDFITNEGDGFLPLPGVVPDMTADTVSYITLQKVYRSQAVRDAEIVYHRARQLLEEINKPVDLITEQEVRLFCREAANLCIIRGSKIADEYDGGYQASRILSDLETPNSLMAQYITLRAIDKFQAQRGYLPGENQTEDDTSCIISLTEKMLSDWGISTSINDDLASEVCRYGGAEIHSISAFMGGCVAHEVIKIITKQYKPFDNVFVFDGATSRLQIFKL